MGRKKQGNGRDSNPKRRGVKVFDGQIVKPGNIIIRQKGTHFVPGPGTYMGSDCTIHAAREGMVVFSTTKGKKLISVVSPTTA
ncbi:MAG: 50S ribosomal protein L27 [candidate division TA06 bacterium ADurb.Bin131]|uniref:Large ribosomal subunit protein bL27 n=1 Tax=candidate division TA06 bacterium ADurb.Bin131 TaxID=1852827 RepID=A0A1V6CB17_UNCT6|nr:MAG: 50S ribosomal protein L27 [candidate division TA06 bacterium ADurb.Bin131]